MINEKVLAWGRSKSCIREVAGYAAQRRAEIGEENVFDFSIGNPSVPSPPQVNDAIRDLLSECNDMQLHGYTPAPGLPSLRKAIADDLNSRYQAGIRPEDLFIGCGAAPELCAVFSALAVPGGEILLRLPLYP